MEHTAHDRPAEHNARHRGVVDKSPFALLLHRVTGANVSDLVRHDAGQLGLVVSREDQALIDEKVPAGKCECIHLVAVDHLDREWHFGIGMKYHILPDPVDVFRDHWVVDEFRLLLNFKGELAAKGLV